jgi:ATP-binding cassette subfamily B protein
MGESIFGRSFFLCSLRTILLAKLTLRYLAKYRPWVIAILVLQLISAIGTLYLPNLNARIIDNGVALGDTGYIWRMGALMLAVSLLQIGAAIAATYFAAKAAMSVGRDLRNDVYGRISGFSEKEISSFGAGSLITRNTNDVQQVQMLVMNAATMMVNAPMLAIGGVIMALRQDVGLSWIIAVAVPVILILAIAVVSKMVPLFRENQEKLDTINRITREQLTGVRVVRAFVREEVEAARYRIANLDLTVVGRKIGSLFVFMFPAMMFVFNVVLIVVLWFGARELDAGTVQIGTILAFMQYVGQILGGVMMATFMTIMIPRAAVSAERISAVLASEPLLKETTSAVDAEPKPGAIEFRNVTFTYPGASKPIIDDVSFVIEPGQTVAVVGSTGAGKSTLINLVARMTDASDGQVLVGGVDVREQRFETLWSQLGLVPQKPFLFSGTIESNMLFGREDATGAEIWHALEIAQAKGFVYEMPKKLGNSISQGGTNVSGGQRQRLAIARAILRRPAILLLDDSFSALDVATDAALRQALWAELPGVTKLVVAQRVTTILDADKILVLDDGDLVGMGTHAELLATCQTYREIAESQITSEQLDKLTNTGAIPVVPATVVGSSTSDSI